MVESIQERLRRIIREQTVRIGQPVKNLAGPVPATVTLTQPGVSSVWHVAQIPGTTLLTLQEFYAAYGQQATRPVSLVAATDGAVAAQAAAPVSWLFSGVLDVTAPIAIPIEVMSGSSTAPWTLYVDDVPFRTGVGSTSLTLALPVGQYALELVAVSTLVGLTLPASVRVSVELNNLLPPVWNSVTTGYLNPNTGSPAVTLAWYNDVRVGGWSVLRREITPIGTITALGTLNQNNEFGVTLAGDVSASIPLRGVVYAGNEELGVVLSATYDSDALVTVLQVRLSPQRTTINAYWSGRRLGTASFREVARVQRQGQSSIVQFVDTMVSVGDPYEYALQSFGLFDQSLYSPISEIQLVRAGDATPPNSITFQSTYPKVVNGLATAKFTTPADDDYGGVHVYYRDLQATGTATSGSSTTLTNTGASFRTAPNLATYMVWIVAGTGQGQVRAVVSNTSTVLTISTGSDGLQWDTNPDATSQYEVFTITKVVTDFGAPNAPDEFNFTPIGYGRYYFPTFDTSGNVQVFGSGAYWDFASGTETFLSGQNQPPYVTITQLTQAVQSTLSAPYNNATNYAVVQLDALDPQDGTTGVTIEYRGRAFYGATASTGSSSTITAPGSPGWSTNQWKNYLVEIVQGTGAGQIKTVSSNTASQLTISGTFSPAPDSTSVFQLAWVTGLTPTTATGTAPDAPAGTRSRYVAVPIYSANNSLQVRAKDTQGVYSPVMVFSVDSDTTPELATVLPSQDNLQDTVFVVGTVDDDARSLKWWLDSEATTTIPSLDITKSFTFSFSLTDGRRRVLNITPYPNIDGTGSGGSTWSQEFERPPRTTVAFSDRGPGGGISNTVVQGTLSCSPVIPDYPGASGDAANPWGASLAIGGSGTYYGTPASYDVPDSSKQYVTGTATGTATGTNKLRDTSKSWTSNQWRGYYCEITAGSGSGQYQQITANTSDELTIQTAWRTAPVAGSSQYAITLWPTNLFAPNPGTKSAYYVRMLTGAATGQIAKIAGNSRTGLTLAAPWNPANGTLNGYQLPASGDVYQIQLGGTNYRLAPRTQTGGSGTAGTFYATTTPVWFTRSASGDYFEFYSEINGLTPEALQRAFVDADSTPSIGTLFVSEVTASKVTIAIGDVDDDAKEWVLYAKKGAWPTANAVDVTGTATGGGQTTTVLVDTSKAWTTNQWAGAYMTITGLAAHASAGVSRRIVSNTSTALTLDSAMPAAATAGSTTYQISRVDGSLDVTFLRLQAPVTTSTLEFDAGDGVWYVVAVPMNSYNSLGERVVGSCYVDSTGTSQGVLSNLSVLSVDNAGVTASYNQVKWDHNAALGAAGAANTWTYKLYAYRDDLGASSRTLLVSGRLPRYDADTSTFTNPSSDTTSNVGSYIHGVDVRAALHSTTSVWHQWFYEIELYDGSSVLQATYTVNDSGDYYERPVPTFSASPVASVFGTGACSLTTYKGSRFPNPSLSTKIVWSITAGYTNDQDYYIRLSLSTQASPSTFLIVGTFQTTTSQYIDYSWYATGDGEPLTTRYATYKVEIVRKSDSVVTSSQTSNTISFSAGPCTGAP